MDPFKEVLADAEGQLGRVQKLLSAYELEPTSDGLTDIGNLMQELTETVHDLSQSIATAQQSPSAFGLDAHEIEARISQVASINAQVSGVQEQLGSLKTSAAPSGQSGPSEQSGPSGQPGGVELSSAERELLMQQTVQEQDDILDSVFQTVTSLREQANVMSRELEDQATMLDDFETHADNTADRLRQGLKRVDYVLKHNRETLSSCCITLLIFALVVLLVLVIIL